MLAAVGRMTVIGGLMAALALLPGTALAASSRAPAKQAKSDVAQPADMDVWLRRLVGRFKYEGLIQVVYDQEDYPDHDCGPLPPNPRQSENPPPPVEPYCKGIKGMGDCVGIGPGPGVQCVLNVTWDDLYEVKSPTELKTGEPNEPVGVFNLPGGVSNLAPAMLLFGIDPGKAGVSYLQVDNKGLPEGGVGFISGDRATFRTSCVNGPTLFNAMKPAPPGRLEGAPRTCERITRIDAKPDSKVVHVAMDIEINDKLWTRSEMTMRRVAKTGK